MKKIIIFVLFTAIAACAARQTPIPEPQSSEALIFLENCGACHSIPHPKRHTYAQWEHMISVMERQIKHEKMAPITDRERNAILGYLKRHSR